ncbi:MAG TPA: hypothetical protein VNF08_03835 [Acidimicrobiales bacterium]|nr:hypothetical protein [Acidimicrobiales bacterium]
MRITPIKILTAALLSGSLALAPALLAGASGTTTTIPSSLTPHMKSFCQSEGMFYAAPAQLAKLWPDVTSTPTPAQANDMVTRLYTMSYQEFDSFSIDAPTKTLKAGLRAVGVASQKQFEEATFFNPGFNATHTAAAEAGYTAIIEKEAATVKKFFASQASVLVGYCRRFNDTSLVQADAVQATFSAQGAMHVDNITTVTPSILKKAAKRAPHYVIFVSLTGHGAAAVAHYRVAAITEMVNVCTTVPVKSGTPPVSVPC